MGLIRYPGSKERLIREIVRHFPDAMSLPLWMNHNRWEYREPFFGAGAIGFHILEKLPPNCSAWLNDIDWGIVCLWKSVQDDPARLAEKIEAFRPSVEAYNTYKEQDGRMDLDPIEIGFRKLALHQMSYSGLGVMSGGPLGGQTQTSSEYNVACRYSPQNLLNQVVHYHEILGKFPQLKITRRDFSELIDDSQKVFLYLDPPYYEKGEQLYKHSMTDDDHVRLAELLRHTANHWVLSYDDHPRIRRLYDWATIMEIEVVYTTAEAKGARPKNKEIVITRTTI